MRRSLVYLLFASPLLAQTFRPAPQQAPIDALIQSYQSAINNSKYDEAAAKRDQARALLNRIPANDPQFGNWAERVSQTYDSGGFALQARDVLEQALAKLGGGSSHARIALLAAISNSWERDRNLLKAASYLEQAVAASEAQPPAPAQNAAAPAFITGIGVSAIFAPSTGPQFQGRFFMANDANLYQQLLSLYRRMGRPQDADAVLTKANAHLKSNDPLLASLYQQQGQIDEAAAIYKHQAADPQQAAFALQSLASLYQEAGRYNDAAAAWRQAIHATEVSGNQGNVPWMYQRLASVFQQAGQNQAADEVYQQLMAGPTGQQLWAVSTYAQFLEQTNRVDQAEKLLTDYQANHPGGEPGEQSNLMLALSNVERLSGKTDLAAEYQRRAFSGQQQPVTPLSGNSPFADAMQSANAAANAGKVDQAFNFALQALDAVHSEPELTQAQSIAYRLATQQTSANAEEIFRRAIVLAESWSAATVTPLVNMQQNYTVFLRNWQRWSELEQTLERYRATLTAARGEGTGWMEDVLRPQADSPYASEGRQNALAASQELVKLEESLSGDTSEPYLNAVQTLANAMEFNGERAGALPLRKRAVTIADLVYSSNDSRRATVHINAAMAYATAGQFAEADALAAQAVALSQHMQPPQPGMFTFQVQEISRMKQAAQAATSPKQ
jgi:tetratricopeptide (TPR) repeat protein